MEDKPKKARQTIKLKRIQFKGTSQEEIIETKSKLRAHRLHIEKIKNEINESIRKTKEGLKEAEELHKKVFG